MLCTLGTADCDNKLNLLLNAYKKSPMQHKFQIMSMAIKNLDSLF